MVARLHAKAGRAAEAIKLLESCLDTDRPQPYALNRLANLKLKAEQYEEAGRLCRLGAERDPGNPRWLRALARVYLLSKNQEKLAETLARLARIDPDVEEIFILNTIK